MLTVPCTTLPICPLESFFRFKWSAIRHQESGGMGLGIVNSIAVEPLPLRMAFPGGVNPPPRNWVSCLAT